MELFTNQVGRLVPLGGAAPATPWAPAAAPATPWAPGAALAVAVAPAPTGSTIRRGPTVELFTTPVGRLFHLGV